jgi:hypothetical protein
LIWNVKSIGEVVVKGFVNNTRELIRDELFDKYLYHYTSFETAQMYILPSSELRMSPFSVVNDPLEYKFDAELVFTSNQQIDLDIDYQYKSMFNDIICDKTKVMCFSQDSREKLIELSNYVNVDLGRGYAKPRMWSQYADNHKGVCLVFEKEKIINSFNNTFQCKKLMNKIIYLDTYNFKNTPYCFEIKHENIDVRNTINEHIIKHKDEILFRKISDWRDEEEFRMLLLDDNINGYRFLPCKDSLCAIIVGDKFPEKDNIHLKRYNNIYIGKIKWNKHTVKLSQISVK